jgi:hypothetical protein
MDARRRAAIQGRGTVALPAELRRKYRLDEPARSWKWSSAQTVDLAANRFRTFDDEKIIPGRPG